MADTAHATEEEIRERYDAPEKVQQQAEVIAAKIRKSKHFIAFTGAGISTSAGSLHCRCLRLSLNDGL